GVPGGGGNGTGDAAADHHPQRMPAQRLAPPGEEVTARPAMALSVCRIALSVGDVAMSVGNVAMSAGDDGICPCPTPSPLPPQRRYRRRSWPAATTWCTAPPAAGRPARQWPRCPAG